MSRLRDEQLKLEKYFNYIFQVEVCKETKRVRESMLMFITTVTPDITMPPRSYLVMSGCTGDFGRFSMRCLPGTERMQLDLLVFSSPEPLSGWYSLSSGSASLHILHNAADLKPATEGGRLVSCGRSLKKKKKAAALTAVRQLHLWLRLQRPGECKALCGGGGFFGLVHFSC